MNHEQGWDRIERLVQNGKQSDIKLALDLAYVMGLKRAKEIADRIEEDECYVVGAIHAEISKLEGEGK